MAPRKRAVAPSADDHEPPTKRRSLRQSAVKASSSSSTQEPPRASVKVANPPAAREKTEAAKKEVKPASVKANGDKKLKTKGPSEEIADDVDSLPAINPEAPRHEGEWYWLMKAEPETRFENGIDVKFSIDDLRLRKKPEGWDGIRAYAARNNMRSMNVGDKAFFYHSNCKEPGIVGIMEIVKEFSEDKTARQPGTPCYDPKSTAENPRWSLVHVEFRTKFAVPVTLKELRELGQTEKSALANMQLLKQSRLSVTRVSGEEWRVLCDLADEKAREAGLEHTTSRL